MDSKRRIDVAMSSSLIDLKAEVLRKQAELESSKSRQQGVKKSLKKSDLLKSKGLFAPQNKNKGIDKRSKKDLEEQQQEQITVEKSRSILEEKAKLYDQMTSSALDHDEHEHPVLINSLVNFTQKAIDNINESRQSQNSRKDGIGNDEDESGFSTDEWTEFVDGLGRTRRCLKEDLPSFLSRDELAQAPLLPEERMMEEKREKWEQDELKANEKDKIHYQDVLYDEIRTHGVGFYNFSKDEEVRQSQMDELKKVTEQTNTARDKINREKSSKKSALKERLAKIRAKKRAKLGLPPAPEDVDKSDEEEEEGVDQEEKDDDKNDDKPPSPKQMRAWDFGKVGVFGPRPTTMDELDEKWMRERRADRLTEFAPPSLYSKQSKGSGSRHSSSGANSSFSKGKYSNFVKSETLKPPPPPEPEKPVFQTPQQFWKSTPPPPPPHLRVPQPSSRPQGPPPPLGRQHPPFSQKSQPIRDELAAPEALAAYAKSAQDEESGGDERRRGGNEIAPPPTFDYYHGGNTSAKSYRKWEDPSVVADAVSSGLKALREQFDQEQKRKLKGRKGGLDFDES